MPVPTFYGVCLITDDVCRLRDFYASVLRLDVHEDEASRANRFAALDTEGALLSFYSREAMEGMAPGSMVGAGTGGFTLEFQVENVANEHQRLVEIGATLVKPPTTQSWGRQSVWFRDPDGNIVNFFAPV